MFSRAKIAAAMALSKITSTLSSFAQTAAGGRAPQAASGKGRCRKLRLVDTGKRRVVTHGYWHWHRHKGQAVQPREVEVRIYTHAWR